MMGGFPLAFGRAGVATRWVVELDDACRRVSGKHFPEAEAFGDVRGVRGGVGADLSHGDGENGILVEAIGCPGGVSPPRGATPELEVPMPRYSTGSRLGFHYKKMSPEQATEAVALYDGGMSIGQVAERFGVSRQGMWDLLRRRTTLRPQRRAGEENHFYRGGIASDAEAHDLMERAIARGELVRPDACESCGGGGTGKDGRALIQGHHDDYNKPLDVRWLCQHCHHEWHKHNTPKRKEVQTELGAVDVISAGFP